MSKSVSPTISRMLKNPAALLKTRVMQGLLLLVALVLVWPAIQSWSDALIRGFWFHLTEDEAFYAEIIQNLKFRGVYGGWDITPFSPSITGGPAFLFPLAAFAKLTELVNLNTAIAARTGCFLFHLGAVSFFIALAKKFIPKNKSIPVIALFIFFQVWRGIPENNYMTFGILAESAVTFYLFASLYFLSNKRFFWAGTCASLVVLAKPYMIFFPIGFLVAMFWLTTENMRSRLRFSTTIILGLALPLLFWFLFMGAKLGFLEMIQYWLNYPKAVSSFSGTDSVLSPVQKFIFHLQHYKEAMSVRAWLFTLVGLAVIGAQVFRKRHVEKSVPMTCLIFAVLHLIWWFFLSPGITPRYLMPVPMVALMGWLFIIQWIVQCLIIDFFSRSLKKLRIRSFLEKSFFFSRSFFYPILFLLVTLAVAKKVIPEWKGNFGNYDSCQFCRQVYVLDEWQKIGSTVVPSKFIWVSTGTHTVDRDLLFSAPARVMKIETSNDLSKIHPKDWASVSDFTQPFFRTWVAQHCVKKINPPLQTVGLWECP